jgi:hypothetical protein
MIELNYLKETILILENAVSPEVVLNDEDYLMIALRILKCDANLMYSEPLKKLVHISQDMDWFRELTEFFYKKMRNDIGEDDA